MKAKVAHHRAARESTETVLAPNLWKQWVSHSTHKMAVCCLLRNGSIVSPLDYGAPQSRIPPVTLLSLFFLALFIGPLAKLEAATLTHFAMVGGVTDTSANVWIRSDVAVTSALVQYQTAGAGWSSPLQSTPVSLIGTNDFTGTLTLTNLSPASAYDYRVVLDGIVQTGTSTFKTLPAKGIGAQFRFAFGADLQVKPYTVFNTVAAQQPDFMLLMGDNVYADLATGTEADFWNVYKANRDSSFQIFGNHVPLFTIWDDHDYGVDNSDSNYALKRPSRAAFGKYWPNPPYVEQNASIYYKFSVADTDFFMLDSRWNRIPTVTMLGAAQLQWLKDQLLASTAKFKFVVCPVMVSDFGNTGETWSSFPAERNGLFQFIAQNNIKNVIFLSGDQHWAGAFLINYPVFQIGYGIQGFYEIEPTPLSANKRGTGSPTNPQVLFAANQDNYYGLARVDTTVVPSQVQFEIHRGSDDAIVYSLTVEEFTPTAAPEIVTSFVPQGVANSPYSQTLTAIGGVSPYQWRITNGSLPSGLTMSSGGTISGVPTQSGTFFFTAGVQDAALGSSSRTLSLVVNPNPAVSLLSQNFSGFLSAWTIVDEGSNEGPSNWTVVNGQLVQQSNIWGGSTAGTDPVKPGSFVYAGNPAWADYEYNASLMSQDNDALGVMFRYQNRQNYYRFSMDQERSYRRLTKTVGGVTTILAQDSTPYQSGRWYAVKIRVNGSAIQVYVDGVLLFSVTDSSIRSGMVALYTWANAPSYFDDVAVVTATGPTLTIASNSLPPGTVTVPYNQTLQALGGIQPYTWTLASGALPAGLTLSPNGVISGTPTTAGVSTFSVQVRDSAFVAAVQSFTTTVVAPLSVVSALPVGAVNVPYNQSAAASGGSPPYTWSFISGSLPQGLNFSQTGNVSGTPTAAGSFAFTVQVRDAVGASTTQSVNLRIANFLDSFSGNLANWSIVDEGTNEAPSSWTIANGQLVQQSNIWGGSATGSDPVKPGTYAFVNNRSWNDFEFNVSLMSQDNDAFGVMFRYVDRQNYYRFSMDQERAYRRLTKTAAGITTILAQDAVPYQTGRFYALKIIVSGSTIQVFVDGALVFNVVDNAIPAGTVALYSWGNTGSFFDDVSVFGTTTSLVTITSTSLVNGNVNIAYGPQTLGASGGTTPYTWSVVSGSLPAGLGLASNGVISGTPTTAGTSTFTAQVRDNVGAIATQSLNLTINSSTLSVVSNSVPSGTVNVAYGPQPLSASGGTTPYSWSIVSGSLPAGVGLAGGSISGTPTVAGTFPFTVQVRDNAGATASQQLNLTINAAAGSVAGVAGYWSFDDGTAADNSGNGSNGTLVNGATVVAGKVGQALSFNGVTQYVNVGNVLNAGSGDLSVFAWVRTTQSGGYNMIVSKRDSSLSNNAGYQLFQNGNGALSFTFADGNSTRVRVDSSGPRINDGNWHLAGLVITRSANAVLYVDGAPAAGGSGSITGQSGVSNNALALRFGIENQTNNSAFAWSGAIDDVRIYNRALSAQEISSLFNGINSAGITLSYNGMLVDRVGQSEFALGPDGKLDGVFTVTLNSGSGNRTVTNLQLTRSGPVGVWDTQGGDAFWSLGAAMGLQTTLLNRSDDTVNFAVAEGTSFMIFASDFQGQMFVPGAIFTLNIRFADGSSTVGSLTLN